MTEVGVRKNSTDEHPDHEARDREQTVSCLHKHRLACLRARLCGVAAHERDIESVLHECVRIDVPGDQGQHSSPPALLACDDLGGRGALYCSASADLRRGGTRLEVCRTAH